MLSQKFEFCKKINNLIFTFSLVEDAYSIRIILLSFEFHPILSFDNLCMKDPLSLIFLFQSPENILEITTITYIMYLHLENSMFTASFGDPNSEVGFVRAVFNAACSLKIFILQHIINGQRIKQPITTITIIAGKFMIS